jgi:predicted aldo/keto reductase-like oxidoreductase
MEDGDRIFADGGAHEAMIAAQTAGKLRYIGFTGHKDPLVHLRMLEVAASYDFRFDAVQMPLNVMDASFRSFGKLVLPVLVRKKIGVLGMKSMASGAILKTKLVTPRECLFYALTLPTSVVIVGVDSMQVLDDTLESVRNFIPLNRAQQSALVRRVAKDAASGKSEPFKTTTEHDSTALNPQWLG